MATDTSGVGKVPAGRVKTRPFFLCSPALAAMLAVSIPAPKICRGGRHVCRELVGDFMGPTFPPRLDDRNIVRTAGARNRSVADHPVVDDRGSASGANSFDAHHDGQAGSATCPADGSRAQCGYSDGPH